MAHEVHKRIEEARAEFASRAEENERLGKLSDRTAELLRQTGVIRMLQPTDFGGYAAQPRDFAEAVMAIAAADPAAGWVAGVVGVHPWELAQMDRKLQEEIWGEDPDTWVASPYMPNGVADPIDDDNFTLSGRWPFSSGSDHCKWDFLGALKGDGSGTSMPVLPPEVMHVVIPRKDYQLIDDSWDVVGLCGTGSKDVVVDKAVVPKYRTVTQDDISNGVAAQRSGRPEALYKLSFGVMFPLGITAATIGICEGALAHHYEIQQSRVSATGVLSKDDPYILRAAAEAASEIEAARVQLIEGISRIHDTIAAGGEPTLQERSNQRRNQVRCAWRAVSALDEIFARSGGGAIRKSSPMQRHWRDAHVGLQHMIHTDGAVYHANSLHNMGLETPQGMIVVV